MDRVDAVQSVIKRHKTYEWVLSGWPRWAMPYSPSGSDDATRLAVDWDAIPSAPTKRRARLWPTRENLFMLTPPPLPSLRRVTEWHVRSQQVSRRNALVASTALAARRLERVEVDEFLDRHSRSKVTKIGPRTA